ncbi:MAG: polyprenyl synthetase family protein [Candidatus Eisenbacteria bacterium]
MSGPTPARSDVAPPRTFDDLFTRGRLRVVEEDYRRVEQVLTDSVQSTFDLVPTVVRHLIGAGGKRIRPVVHCLAARMCGYSGNGHITIASVSEMIHSSTLFHDDVIDEGRVRRGRPTANRVWGNQVPVLVGDFVFARAFTIMMDHGYYTIARHLGETVQDLVTGELLQLTHAGNPLLTREVYEEIIRCKTASLFSWCGRAAAMLAELPEERAAELSEFGHHLGTAFQITDDVLDYTGTSTDTGKGMLSDLAEGKVTLPLILAMERDPSLAAEIQDLFPDGNGQEGDPVPVATRIRKSGAIEDSILIAEEHAERAVERLAGFGGSDYKDALVELCRFTRNRIH